MIFMKLLWNNQKIPYDISENVEIRMKKEIYFMSSKLDIVIFYLLEFQIKHLDNPKNKQLY